MSDWISVKERLPEEKQRCLIWLRDEVWIAFFECEDFRDEGEYYGMAFAEQPLFWMPLPEPPNG